MYILRAVECWWEYGEGDGAFGSTQVLPLTSGDIAGSPSA